MDPDVPVRYIRENFRPEDRVAIVLIQKETRRVIQRIATAERIARPDYQAHLRHSNASRHEVYIGMNPVREGSRSRTKGDIAEIRHVYLDFDSNGTSAVQALMKRDDLPEPNYLINTSPDRWQVVWKVERFGMDEAERLMRHLSRETGADPAATDSSRVLRLPGFISHKHGAPFLVRAQTRAIQTYGPEHFPHYPSEEQGVRQVVNTESARDRSTGASRLSQSEKDWAYAKRALSRREKPETVIDAIARFRIGEKSNPRAYAARTVQKAIQALESERTLAGSEFGR